MEIVKHKTTVLHADVNQRVDSQIRHYGHAYWRGNH